MALPKLNVPRYQVTLPSTGERLNMRPYLVKEEKILLIALESKDAEQIQQAIRDIILGCYDIKDVNVLTSFDLEYLFLQLRAKSVGEKLKVQYNCQADGCDGITESEINIDNLVVEGLEQNKTFMLDEDMGVGITMQYPTLNVLKEMDLTSLETTEGLLNLVKACIDTVFDDENVYRASEQSDAELNDFVGSLRSEQFKYIQEFFLNVPAVIYREKYICGECEKENEVEIKGLQNFFT
tara:strand:+ start:1429 stop:2142 length:714 start_codon:yes stop_codon:yes gene_type:complete